MSIALKRAPLCVLPLLIAFASVPLTPTIALATNNSSRSYENNRSYKNGKENDAKSDDTAINDKEKSSKYKKHEPENTPQAPHISGPQEKSPAKTSDKPHYAEKTKSADPAGNNGTIKVDGQPFDSHPDNQPHVPCIFQIDFYGYDKGVGNAQVTFELHNPTLKSRTLAVTSGNLSPNIGQDAASGGTDLDASETYTLKFIGAPHDKQGFHVKLTVNAPGSQGADVKHKVFWVSSCETPVNPAPATPTKPQTPGVILGEAAKTTKPVTATLPARLPSTGSVHTFWLLGLFAAVATYGAVYALRSPRPIRNLQ